VVQQRDAYFVLGQRAMVDALLRLTDAETKKRSHGRLAELFAQGPYKGRMLSVRHWQRAGDDGRAFELVLGYGDNLASGTMDWGAMRLSISAEIGLNALAHFRMHGGSPRDGIRLRRMLLMTCSVYDWSIARLGDEGSARYRRKAG